MADESLGFAARGTWVTVLPTTDVQVVVNTVFVTIATTGFDVSALLSAGDDTVDSGMLETGPKLVLCMLDVIGRMLFTTSPMGKAVDKALSDFWVILKEPVKSEETEQLVSVTVVLAVTVTIDTW